MRMHDVSMAVDQYIPVYNNKADKKPVFTIDRDYNSGNVYESVIKMNMHTGTHIDAPLHMLIGGNTIDKLDITKLVTECTVFDFQDVQDKISSEDLKRKNIKSGSFILLKTRNSFYEGFDPEFVYVDATGAEYLKELQISGVGIDSLGIERAQPGHETHKTLLGNGIIILEGLRLADIEEGVYQMVALPLKLIGTEAAPARVILLEK